MAYDHERAVRVGIKRFRERKSYRVLKREMWQGDEDFYDDRKSDIDSAERDMELNGEVSDNRKHR